MKIKPLLYIFEHYCLTQIATYEVESKHFRSSKFEYYSTLTFLLSSVTSKGYPS